MSLHQAARPKDNRWVLTLTSEPRARNLTAVDQYDQRWESTRYRRYNTQTWDCGHMFENYSRTVTNYARNTSYDIVERHNHHLRFWVRKTKRRGIASPVTLCAMTATLNPDTGRHDITPSALTA